MEHKGSARVTPSSDLTLLLAAEQELETMLATARASASELVETARVASRTASNDLELELAATDARFQQEVEGDRTRRAEEVLAAARHRAAEYDGVTTDRIAALADRALTRLLAGMRA